MTKGNRFPRGHGTYHAQIEFGCVTHGMHELYFSSADDLAWIMAERIARLMKENGYDPRRVLTWFRAQPPHRSPWRPEPRGSEIQDDIPF